MLKLCLLTFILFFVCLQVSQTSILYCRNSARWKFRSHSPPKNVYWYLSRILGIPVSEIHRQAILRCFFFMRCFLRSGTKCFFLRLLLLPLSSFSSSPSTYNTFFSLFRVVVTSGTPYIALLLVLLDSPQDLDLIISYTISYYHTHILSS
jgi:hypothetical protein